LTTESASGSLSGTAGFEGQSDPDTGELEVLGVTGEKSCDPEGTSGVGAGMTTFGKTALTAESRFRAFS
jgi:hypothetical protein